MSLENWSKENYLHEKKKRDKVENEKKVQWRLSKKQQWHSRAQHAEVTMLEKQHTMLGWMVQARPHIPVDYNLNLLST